MKKIRNLIIMLVLSLTYITAIIQPVNAETHDSANRADAVTAQVSLLVYVRNDAGAIVNSYSDESALVSVQGGDVDGAIASAEGTILANAMSWLSDKGTVVSEEVQEYVNVYDYGPGLYRMRFIEAIAIAQSGTETPPAIPDPEPETSQEPEPDYEPIPLEIYGAGEYVCGPNAGSYCITINQNVSEVTSVKFRMSVAPSGRNFVHSVGISRADGYTYITVPQDVMNVMNQESMDMSYEVSVKTNVGEASLYMTIKGYYYGGSYGVTTDDGYTPSTPVTQPGNTDTSQSQQNDEITTQDDNDTPTTSPTDMTVQGNESALPEESSSKENKEESKIPENNSSETSKEEESVESLTQGDITVNSDASTDTNISVSEPSASSEDSMITDTVPTSSSNAAWPIIILVVLIVLIAIIVFWKRRSSERKEEQ